MTEKELKRYYYLKREIEEIDRNITEIEENGGVSGIRYKEVDVMSTTLNKSILDKLDKLLDQWKERRLTALEEYIKIESYINSIEDLEIRQIMRYRYLDLKNWNEISVLVHMDRTTIYRKLKNFNTCNTMQH